MKIELLIENELFVENRIDYLRQQNANLPEFDQLIEFDPTDKKIYLQWIIKQFKANKFRLEDKRRVSDMLQHFDKLKQSLPQNEKDINKWDWYSLQDKIEDARGIELNTDIEISMDGVKVLYDGPYGKVLIPTTKEASCRLGEGTRWCTATEQDNMFSHYNNMGPLYVIIDEKGDKYQLHFETSQFMDRKDKPVSQQKVKFFREVHPAASKLFAQYENDLLAARNVSQLHGYAIGIIGGRWPEAEPIILAARDLRHLSDYARDVIKDRWPEAEPRILTDPFRVYIYAETVIEGRWPEAEPIILRGIPKVIAWYAIGVYPGRWLEAELRIKKDPDAWAMYKEKHNL